MRWAGPVVAALCAAICVAQAYFVSSAQDDAALARQLALQALEIAEGWEMASRRSSEELAICRSMLTPQQRGSLR